MPIVDVITLAKRGNKTLNGKGYTRGNLVEEEKTIDTEPRSIMEKAHS